MKKLYLNIVSPEKEIYNGEVESVTLPGTIGTFTILPQHAPIVSSLREGKVQLYQAVSSTAFQSGYDKPYG